MPSGSTRITRSAGSGRSAAAGPGPCEAPRTGPGSSRTGGTIGAACEGRGAERRGTAVSARPGCGRPSPATVPASRRPGAGGEGKTVVVDGTVGDGVGDGPDRAPDTGTTGMSTPGTAMASPASAPAIHTAATALRVSHVIPADIPTLTPPRGDGALSGVRPGDPAGLTS